MNNFKITYPNGCRNLNQSIHYFCLPDKVDCVPTSTETVLVECDNRWNCNLPLQTDRDYFYPILSGEKFMLQVQEYDEGSTDRTNPNTGWTDWIDIELIDKAGTTIVDTVTDPIANLSDRWYNAWNGKYSYQVIEIDTSKATFNGLDCFYFKIKTTGGREICTQEMQLVSDCKDQYVSLESDYSKQDCYNNDYREPTAYHGVESFKYSNRIWIRAHMKDKGGTNEVTAFADRPKTNESEDVIGIRGYYLVPPYMKNIIKNQIFMGRSISVNGVSGYLYEDMTMRPSEGSSMFPVDLEVFKICRSELTCD